MARAQAKDDETQEFKQIFSELSQNNRQYSMAVLRSLQFAEEQERDKPAKLKRSAQKKGGKAPEQG
jgi:hypothetical protein